MDVGYDLAGGLNGPCLPSRDVADVLPCQVNTVIRLAEGRVVGFPVVGGIGYPAAFLVFSPFPVDGKDASNSFGYCGWILAPCVSARRSRSAYDMAPSLSAVPPYA